MSKRRNKQVRKPDGSTITPNNPLQDAFIRLEQAEQYRLAGKYNRAQKICMDLIKEHSDYVAALHTLGLVHAAMDNHEQALNCLTRAAMHNPRNIPTLTALSGVYLEMKAPETAAYTLEQARAINPKDSNVLITLGEIYRAEMEYDLAKQAFVDAREVEPDLLPATTGYGWACSALGENAEAIATFEELVKKGINKFEPFSALAPLPGALMSIDFLAELQKYLEGPDTSDSDETMVTFVKAAALDKAGRYKEAWEALLPANRDMFGDMQDQFKRLNERQERTLGLLRSNPVTPANRAHVDDHPISLFILGPSRSGKTSLEELVATLDGVKRGYENPCVDASIRHTFQDAGLLTNRFFEVLPPQLYPQCRKQYVDELHRRAGSAKVFTNTHPNRMNDAALMSIVFPNIRFIFVRRNPQDTALRIFMRHYQTGNAYSYDLKATYDHIDWYHQMAELMAEKIPDHVRIINYEDMVADPAAALKTAADFCGLPMPEGPVPPVGDDRGCADPYQELMSAALA